MSHQNIIHDFAQAFFDVKKSFYIAPTTAVAQALIDWLQQQMLFYPDEKEQERRAVISYLQAKMHPD
ncbi:MAG: hypothetical protein AAF310_05485 [Myxococcota bacterium]